MATSLDVNVKLGSQVGATQTGGAFQSGRPRIQTTATMNGTSGTLTVSDIPLLSINTFTTFVGYANIRTPAQDVLLTNVGNAVLTVTNATFSLRGGISPVFYWTPSAALYNTITNTASTITILPGTTATFKLGYIGSEIGEHSNYLTFFSNNVTGAYKVNTIQQILPDADNFDLSTTTYVTTVTVLGLQSSKTIEIIPTVNGSINTSFPAVNFTTSVAGNPAWYVSSTGTNAFTVTFDPDYVQNINNTTTGYTATVAVTVAGSSRQIQTVAKVDIDPTLYKNLSTWISPASSYNSIIGISFDMFAGIKTLTIGVGAGGDSTPIYADGGGAFAVLRNLAIGAGTIDVPYPYWSTVYSIPLETSGTYLSGELNDIGLPKYVKKTTNGLDYADYFGFEQSVGSMFIVTYNGYDLVNIEINNLREPSGNTAFDLTMANLTRAFHYHSTIDNPSRYYQLEAAVLGDPRTRLFRGFVATALSGNTRTYSVNVVAATLVYNESLTGPSSVIQGSANFNVQITGGTPNTGYSWTGATSGSGTLNASGQASIPFSSGGTITESLGTYSFTATFAASGNTRTYSVNIVAAPPGPPVYNESLTGPGSVIQGSANFNVQITGGTPNTGYSWTGATSGSGTLNASGQASIPFSSGGTITESLGTYSFTATFATNPDTWIVDTSLVPLPT